MKVRELYTPKRMAASGTLVAAGGAIGGFICTTNGTIQITNGELAGGSDLVSAMVVTAGSFYPIGFTCANGAYAILTSGAVGTFLV